MDFNEFVTRTRDFVKANLSDRYDWRDAQISNDSNGTDEWSIVFSRQDRKTGDKLWTIQLLYSCGVFELSETFGEWQYVPDIYIKRGLKPLESMPNQTPMFIYGQYRRLGDALNSLLKGDSLDGRRYKELYW